MRIIAEITTDENVTATAATIEFRVFRPDEVEHMAWSVDGRPSLRAVVERDDTVHFTASSLFN